MTGLLDSSTFSEPRFSRGLVRAGHVAWRLPEVLMAFFIGLALFVGVCGYLDARLGWPPRRRRQR